MWLWSAGIGSAVLAGLLGYFTIGWTSGNTNDRLLRDLPFIENVDLYQQIEDLVPYTVFDQSISPGTVLDQSSQINLVISILDLQDIFDKLENEK